MTEAEELSVSVSELEAAIAAIQDPVWLLDPRGHVLLANAAALRLHGFGSLEECNARLPAVLGTFEVRRPDGQPVPPAERPFARALRGDYVQQLELHVRSREGLDWVGLYTSTPLQTSAGRTVIKFTIRDVTSQRRAELARTSSEAQLQRQAAELEAANAALSEANRHKDEFLGMLSHELRNPLAAISSSIHVLERVGAPGEDAGRARRVIRRQAELLERLVGDLLDVTRVARGKIELRTARIDLGAVVARAADDARPLMDEQGIVFHMALPGAPLFADADPARLTQVVGNLLHNAAKFTPRGGEVRLSLTAAQGMAALTVSDTGQGIEPALLASIFEPFVQGRRTLAREHGGLGLGLSLVKGLVGLHGGTVRAESEGAGLGARLVVTLPLAGAPGPEPAPPERRPSPRRRVLVVDDNVDAAESLADYLRLLGHEVEVAHDGPGGLEAARARRPEAVLCDIGLPGVSGYEIARALRAEGVEALLVALSGYGQPEDVRAALEAGFDRHLAKPASPEEIERLLGA